MKKLYLFLFVGIMTLSGCGDDATGSDTDAAESGVPVNVQPYGGVLISADNGRTLEPRSYVSASSSLAEANVLSFAQDPVNSDVLYVGTEQSGIFRSEDKGLSWKRFDFAPTFTESIVISPLNTDTIYASAIWNGRGRVFVSEDAGASWKDIYSEPAPGNFVRFILISPEDPSTIFVGTDGNNRNGTVVKSVDGGATWKSIFTGRTNIDHMAFDASDRNTMYLHAKGGDIYKSRDLGASWDTLEDLSRENAQDKDLLSEKDVDFYEGRPSVLVVHPSISGILYVGTDQGIFVSKDFGLTWDEEDIIGSSKGLGVDAIAVNDQNQSFGYIAGRSVYVKASTDGAWSIADLIGQQRIDEMTYSIHESETIFITLKKPVKKGLLGF